MAWDVSFGTARARLGILARDGMLLRACQGAYREGIAGLAQAAAGLSRLAVVRLASLADTDQCARIALRWQAPAAGGRLFPALEADLMLTPPGNRSRCWPWPGRTGGGPAGRATG
jgi:hypothetical protein